jgi:hypothetical protein
MCSVHSSTGGTPAACKSSDRAKHSCVQPNKEIVIKITRENQGDRGTTHVCIHAGIACMSGADSYSREKNKEINLAILGGQINLHSIQGENQGIRERKILESGKSCLFLCLTLKILERETEQPIIFPHTYFFPFEINIAASSEDHGFKRAHFAGSQGSQRRRPSRVQLRILEL